MSSPIEGFGPARVSCHREPIVRGHRVGRTRRTRPGSVSRDTRLRDAAFVRLADEHLDKAYRLARAILRDPAEAQDATHDAFVQAWRKWETLRDQSRFEPWFDRILVNTCRNRLRSTRRLATDISVEVALATGDHAGRAEDRDVIGAAIAALSPDHQVVVALRYYRDLTGRRDREAARESREGRSSPVSTTHSSGCTTRSTRPTPRGPSDDRPRARTAAARLVRGRGRRDRVGAGRPARGPRHDPGDDAGTAPRTRRDAAGFTLLAVAAVLMVGGRPGRRFRAHPSAAGR